ncbi:MAG: hypothetical protein DMG61_16795 [Acidobacteria bacterium]|nr:MAG: hypothetical protein DMG61_16795 [Acidobacteriota bacterium]
MDKAYVKGANLNDSMLRGGHSEPCRVADSSRLVSGPSTSKSSNEKQKQARTAGVKSEAVTTVKESTLQLLR